MSEQHMRQRVIQMLHPLDAISVENAVYPGTPDINFCDGWIELKQISKWPFNPNTNVLLRHFTPQQRVWLMRRWRAGGNVWMLLQCNREWLLLSGETAADLVGRAPRNTLIQAAHKYWEFGVEGEDLIAYLKR